MMTTSLSTQRQVLAPARIAASLTAIALSLLATPVALATGWSASRGTTSSEILNMQIPSYTAGTGFDDKPIVLPNNAQANARDASGELWVNHVHTEEKTVFRQPFVQKNLRLGMRYNYNFVFNLAARDLNGRAMTIPDGLYQIQLAVVRVGGDKKIGVQESLRRYVTGTSIVRKVSAASFNQAVSLHFLDMRDVVRKHHVYIEFIPLEDKCVQADGSTQACVTLTKRGDVDPTRSTLRANKNLRTYTLEAPFVPNIGITGTGGDAQELKAEDKPYENGTLAEYMTRAQALQNINWLRPLPRFSAEQHASAQGLTRMDIAAPALKQYMQRYSKNADAETVIRQLLSTRGGEEDPTVLNLSQIDADQRALLASFCAYFHQERFRGGQNYAAAARYQQAVNLCYAHPETYLRISRVSHIGRPLVSQAKLLNRRVGNYTVMTNFMVARSASKESSMSASIGPAAILFKAIGGAAASIVGIDLSFSASESHGRSQSESNIASVQMNIGLNYTYMKIPTVGSQECMEIRPIRKTSPFFDNRPNASTGIYICSEPNKNVVNHRETYAHIYEKCAETTNGDCYDATSQSVNLSLRGDREISAFFYLTRSKLSPDRSNSLMPFEEFASADRFFAETPMTDANEIIAPVALPSNPIPSFLQRLTGQYAERF